MTQRTDRRRSQLARDVDGDSRSSQQRKEDAQQPQAGEGEARGYYGSGGSYGYGGAFEHGGHSPDVGAQDTQKRERAAEEFYEARGGFGHETSTERGHELVGSGEPGSERAGQPPDGDGDE